MGEVELVVQPPTRYAWLGQDRIAYQVLGEGPVDLVFTPGSFGNIDMVWEDPGAALFLRRLASFCRLIRFDRRGTSASDPLPLESLPPWESYADEVTAVLDEVGSERAAVMATLDAGPMAMFFAATYPERTAALILVNTTARWVATASYPTGIPRELAEALTRRLDEVWGTEEMVDLAAPSRAGDDRFRSWYARFQRSIAGPRAVQAFARALFETDARSILPSIQVPTLVMHRESYAFLPVDPRPVPRRADSRSDLRGAGRLGWGRVLGDARRDPRAGRGVPGRGPSRREREPLARHRALHRHREVHRAGRRGR